jgi:hypothetical protein
LNDDLDFVETWIDEAPHKPGCSSFAAGAENACSCGKKEALAALTQLDPESWECPGDCDSDRRLCELKTGVESLIDRGDWAKLTLDEAKRKLEELVR